jgi:hypothetical protein
MRNRASRAGSLAASDENSSDEDELQSPTLPATKSPTKMSPPGEPPIKASSLKNSNTDISPVLSG